MSDATTSPGNRRPTTMRGDAWAMWLARKAAGLGFSANAISLLSLVFAGAALVGFLIAPDMQSTLLIVLAWVGTAACIQMRLLCNLLDGMVAVECGKRSAVGALYNEVPDRIADVLIFVGAGYATNVPPGVVKLFDVLPLGWSCAIAALLAAYLRTLGASLTGTHCFVGPMAKQHRMRALIVTCIVACVTSITPGGNPHLVLVIALTAILAGTLITCWRRLKLISDALKAGSSRG